MELFIQQFMDGAYAIDWEAEISLLQLREVLKGPSRECGRAPAVTAIFEAFRVRFGMLHTEANIRKDSQTSLQKYATRVEQLVNLANPTLPDDCKSQMTLRTFKSTLEHDSLQRHLLVADERMLTDAVRIGNEYLQIGNTCFGRSGRTGVYNINVNEENTTASVMDELITEMITLLAEILQKIEQTQVDRSTPQWKRSRIKLYALCLISKGL